MARKYYLINQSDWAAYRIKMEEAYGHVNVSPITSIDGTKAIVEFDDNNLPDGFTPLTSYTNDEIKILLRSDSRFAEVPDPISLEEYLTAAIKKGKELFFTLRLKAIESVEKGVHTEVEVRQSYNNLKELFLSLKDGKFRAILNNEANIATDAIFTQGKKNALISALQDFENKHKTK